MFMDIFETIKADVLMCTYFSVIMVIGMLANTVMGVITATVSESQTFKWSILLKGLLKNIGIILAVDLAAASLSGIVAGIKHFSIDIINPEILSDVSVTVIVAILITLTVTVYGKQFIEKFKSLGGLKSEDKGTEEVVETEEYPLRNTK